MSEDREFIIGLSITLACVILVFFIQYSSENHPAQMVQQSIEDEAERIAEDAWRALDHQNPLERDVLSE